MTDASAKLLIAKGVSTDEEFKAAWRRVSELPRRAEAHALVGRPS
jgi:hypothetical protein